MTNFKVLTIFPDMFPGPLSKSITGSALKKNLFKIEAINIRDFAKDKHQTVDDTPFGGGAGMVIKADVLGSAIESVMNFDDKDKMDCHASLGVTKVNNLTMTKGSKIKMTAEKEIDIMTDDNQSASSRSFCKKTVAIPENKAETKSTRHPERSVAIQELETNKPKIIYLSPRGKVFNQKIARELASEKEIILICGRYEGIDQRVLDEYEIEEISIGDYVLSGGELACFVLIDSVVRNIAGVLGDEKSLSEESFCFAENDDFSNLLEYPHYTKPSEWRSRKVPEVLTQGNHQKINQWRRNQAIEITKKNRPDLIKSK